MILQFCSSLSQDIVPASKLSLNVINLRVLSRAVWVLMNAFDCEAVQCLVLSLYHADS